MDYGLNYTGKQRSIQEAYLQHAGAGESPLVICIGPVVDAQQATLTNGHWKGIP